MADILLSVGIQFKPSDIDTKVIKDTISKALANTAVNISRISVNTGIVKEAFKSLKIKLGPDNFEISNAVGGKLTSAIQSVFSSHKFTLNIDTASLTRQISEILSTAGATVKRNVATTTVTGNRPGNITNEIKQVTALGEAAKGITFLTTSADKSVNSLKNLNAALNALQGLPPGVKASVSDLSNQLDRLRGRQQVFSDSLSTTAARLKSVQTANAQAAQASRDAAANIQKSITALSKTPTGQLNKRVANQSELLGPSNSVIRQQEQLNRVLLQGGESAEVFGAKLGQITSRFATYLISIKAILVAQNAFNAAISSITSFDSAIQDLGKVLNVTPERFDAVSKAAFDISRQTGRSIDEVLRSLNEFVRQGFALPQALEETRAALIAVNVTELNYAEATRLITSVTKIFGDEVGNSINALDQLSAAGDKSAASATQIAQGLFRSAASAKAVGVSFQELNAIIGASVERTQLSGENLGTALKTIFASLIASKQQIQDFAAGLGTIISPSDSVFERLKKLSEIFPKLNDEQLSQLNTLIAGKRRFTELSAILQSFSRAQELVVVQANASGTALAKNEKELQKLSTQATLVSNNFAELVNVIAGTTEGAQGAGVLRGIISDILTLLSQGIRFSTDFVRAISGLNTAFFGINDVISGISKSLFFTAGVTIIKNIALGALKFLGIANNLTGLFAQIGGLQKESIVAQARLTSQTATLVGQETARLSLRQATVAATGKELVVQKQLTAEIERQTKTAAAKGGAKTALVFGAFTALEPLKRGFESLSELLAKTELKISPFGEEVSKLAGKFTEIGLIVGTLVGPIAGVTVGLGGLLVSTLAISKAQEFAAQKQLALVEAQANTLVTLRSAADAGDAFATAAKKLSGVTDINSTTQTRMVDATTLVISALSETKTNVESFGKTLDKSITEFAQKINNQARQFEVQKELKKQVQSAQLQTQKAQIEFSVGDVSDPFKGVLDSVAEFENTTQQIQISLDKGVLAGETLLRVQQAINELGADDTRNREQIIKDTGTITTESLAISKALDEANRQASDFEIQVSDVTREINDTVEKAKQLAQIKLSGDAKELTDEAGKQRDISTTEAAIQARIAELQKQRSDLQQKSVEAQKLTEKLNEQFQSSLKENQDILLKIVSSEKEIGLAIQKNVAEVSKLTAASQKRIEQLNREADVENEIRKIRLQSIATGQDTTIDEARVREQAKANEEILRLKQQQANEVNALNTKIAEAEKQGNTQLAKVIADAVQATREAQAKQLSTLEIELQTKIDIELQKINFDKLLESIRTLTDFQIRNIESVAAAEQQASERRVELIKEIGNTKVGQKFLEGPLNDIGDFFKNKFGAIGALVVREQEKAANSAIDSIVRGFQLLEKSGLKPAERLQRLQEVRNEILQKNEELIGKEREAILERVKEAADKVNESEKSLIDARNQIPALNAKVIEAEKSVGAANAELFNALQDLGKAYQAATDANAQFRFGVLKAAFDVKQSTGFLGSISDQIASLNNIFSTITQNFRTSQEQELQIRKDIAQQVLQIYQTQFAAIKGLGLEAATANADQLEKLKEGVGAAQSIAAGASVAKFSPEQLSEALRFKDIFPEIEKAIATFGLEKIGIKGQTLETLNDQMVRLAEVTAESNKQQVNASAQQVQAAQENVQKAEEQLNNANQQLAIAGEQRDAQLRVVAQLATQVAVSQAGFARLQDEAANNLSILGETKILTDQMAKSLQSIDTKITDLINQSFNPQQISSAVASILSNGAALPNAAKGTLSSGEMIGLASAARREKMAMPPGSKLMLANTSEVVLTRNQAKNVGLRAIPKPFAAFGNAGNAGSPSQENSTLLNNTLTTLLNKLNSPGFIQQNIDVSVDTNKTIDVKGLDGIDAAVQRAFQAQTEQFVNKQEQKAINDVVLSIVGKLNELGIVNSQGQ